MPTRPKTKALEEALEKLQAAREAFAQAFDGILSQLDMSPIEGALADWRPSCRSVSGRGTKGARGRQHALR